MITIRHATKDDVGEIVKVHQSSFEGFFLTLLGTRFLAKLYLAFITHPTGILLVAENDDARLIGFAAGTTAPDEYFMELRRRSWLRFLLAAIPGIRRNPIRVIKKLYHAVFYKGDRPSTMSEVALLSSIAVLPEMAGKAVGKALLADFEQQVKLAELPAVFLTTDKFGNDNVVAFYQRDNYQIESEFTQPDGRQMLRLLKHL